MRLAPTQKASQSIFFKEKNMVNHNQLQQATTQLNIKYSKKMF